VFVDVDSKSLHIAEIAHILAGSDDGPRALVSLPQEARGEYENLILLCPSCHTLIDKAPDAYPDRVVRDWKLAHRARIMAAFGAVEYESRHAVRHAIEPILAANRSIFETYGPLNDYRFNPESDVASQWRRKVVGQVLPNNRRLLAILDANRRHLTDREQMVLERFRQHVDDLEDRHLGGGVSGGGTRFPVEMTALLSDSAVDDQ
jgi:hypothetical protein